MTKMSIALAFAATLPSIAHAGPPFATDDPEPTDYGHFEIYLYSQSVSAGNNENGPELGLEVNYGALPDLQISASLPVGFSAPSRAEMRLSDGEFGAKYRFIEEDADGWRPQVSFYPSVEVALGNSGRNTGDSAMQEFLPLWAQKSFGDWTTFGGGGYRIDPGHDARDSWFTGWAILRRLGDRFQLGAELFRQTAETRGDKDSAGFNVGALFDLNAAFHLVGSAGTGIGGDADKAVSYYLALEWTA
ncbi:MAG: hypothetical protein ABSC92_14610 [Rhizomicrobium sp.]